MYVCMYVCMHFAKISHARCTVLTRTNSPKRACGHVYSCGHVSSYREEEEEEVILVQVEIYQ